MTCLHEIHWHSSEKHWSPRPPAPWENGWKHAMELRALLGADRLMDDVYTTNACERLRPLAPSRQDAHVVFMVRLRRLGAPVWLHADGRLEVHSWILSTFGGVLKGVWAWRDHALVSETED